MRASLAKVSRGLARELLEYLLERERQNVEAMRRLRPNEPEWRLRELAFGGVVAELRGALKVHAGYAYVRRRRSQVDDPGRPWHRVRWNGATYCGLPVRGDERWRQQGVAMVGNLCTVCAAEQVGDP